MSDKPEKKESLGSFAIFCLKLAVIVLVFRSFVFTSFNIPSESMMPRLLVGDYLFAAKWPYGYSSRSLPYNVPLIPGRIFASTPERGDIVIFEHPIDGTDYIKRVIGLPGDQIQMIGGVLHINGAAVQKDRIEDLVLPTTVDKGCGSGRSHFTQPSADGGFECHFPQFRETLPNGVSYEVLDFGQAPFSREWNVSPDNTDTYIVPEGHLFMMGDNRDNSLDSRFPAAAGNGVGFVPEENVIARASFMYFSTDGHADWIKPWTWFTAARWGRIGRGI